MHEFLRRNSLGCLFAQCLAEVTIYYYCYFYFFCFTYLLINFNALLVYLVYSWQLALAPNAWSIPEQLFVMLIAGAKNFVRRLKLWLDICSLNKIPHTHYNCAELGYDGCVQQARDRSSTLDSRPQPYSSVNLINYKGQGAQTFQFTFSYVRSSSI